MNFLMNFLITPCFFFMSVSLPAQAEDTPRRKFEVTSLDNDGITLTVQSFADQSNQDKSEKEDFTEEELSAEIENFHYATETKTLTQTKLNPEPSVSQKWVLSLDAKDNINMVSSDEEEVVTFQETANGLVVESKSIRTTLNLVRHKDSVYYYNDSKDLVAEHIFARTSEKPETVLIFADPFPSAVWASLLATHYFPLAQLTKRHPLQKFLLPTLAGVVGGIVLLAARDLYRSSPSSDTPSPRLDTQQEVEAIFQKFYSEVWEEFTRGNPGRVRWSESELDSGGGSTCVVENGRWEPLDTFRARDLSTFRGGRFMLMGSLTHLDADLRGQSLLLGSSLSSKRLQKQIRMETPLTPEEIAQMSKRVSRQVFRTRFQGRGHVLGRRAAQN